MAHKIWNMKQAYLRQGTAMPPNLEHLAVGSAFEERECGKVQRKEQLCNECIEALRRCDPHCLDMNFERGLLLSDGERGGVGLEDGTGRMEDEGAKLKSDKSRSASGKEGRNVSGSERALSSPWFLSDSESAGEPRSSVGRMSLLAAESSESEGGVVLERGEGAPRRY